MLYTTVLLEDEPSMKARLMDDLEQWMTLGQTHLQGSFAAFYLAAHKHSRRRLEESDGALHTVAKGTVQALLLDMASMGPDWKWQRAVNRTADPRTLPHRPGVCSKRPCPQVAEYAMLPSLRPPAEYYWQRSPTALVGGKAAVAHELPPIDGLLAYWVGKYGGAM